MSAVKAYYDMERYLTETNLQENNFVKKWFNFNKCFGVSLLSLFVSVDVIELVYILHFIKFNPA